MQHIPLQTVKTWDRFYRSNFINSLTGFKAVSLIGTVNKAAQPNLAIFSSIVHLGSDPALVGYINRPLAAAPNTIENIKATNVYTINHIHPGILSQAHQTSAKYQAGVSEFTEAGLTPVYKQNIIAPFVQESMVQYSLQLVEVVPVKHNNTFLVIGSIQHVFLAEGIVEADGFIAIDETGSIASLGSDGYYLPQKIARYKYAKPGVAPQIL
jgi:flavin reductase (DIM6/NTAB) family NADH-FMN oxidoreductase RutF